MVLALVVFPLSLLGQAAASGEKDYDSQIVEANKRIQANPKDNLAFNKRGNAYYGKRDYDQAIKDFTTQIELETARGYAEEVDLALKSLPYESRARAYAGKGDYDTAIKEFTAIIEFSPLSSSVYGYRGDAYTNKGNYGLAVADYNQQLELRAAMVKEMGEDWGGPTTLAPIYVRRGYAYYRDGKHDLAIADYSQAIALTPKSADAFNRRGLLLLFSEHGCSSVRWASGRRCCGG